MEANLTELRRAQDALRKAFDIERKLLDKLDAAVQQEKDDCFSLESEI